MDEFLLLSLKIIIEISLEFWMVYSCEVVVASKYGGLTRYKKVVRKKFLSVEGLHLFATSNIPVRQQR